MMTNFVGMNVTDFLSLWDDFMEIESAIPREEIKAENYRDPNYLMRFKGAGSKIQYRNGKTTWRTMTWTISYAITLKGIVESCTVEVHAGEWEIDRSSYGSAGPYVSVG